MFHTPTMRRIAVLFAALALVFGTAACGPAGDKDKAADKTINLGIIPSWTDGLSTAHLWKAVLEDEGYTVKITEISDAGTLYTGVANGNIDIYPSAWSEVTHDAFMQKYGPKLEDLGAYYEGAKLTFAVPEYTKIDSIADLADNEKMFDGKIIGIEAGAGLTKTTKEQVIPQYGLDKAGFTLVESSTTAMLAELKKATKSKKDIVVTLWKPFWANAEFPVKTLEDPKGALGDSESLHAIATKGFGKAQPEVAKMFGNFKLDDAQYGSLENMVVNEYGKGKEQEAVRAWLKANPDFVAGLKG